MRATLLKNLKKGDYFKFKPTENAPVWVKDAYCRSEKKYEVYKFDDVCHFSFRKGSVTVYVDFEF